MQDIKIGKKVYKGVYKIKAFDEDGNEIPFFDVSESEVTEETLAQGKHGYDKDGNLIEGKLNPKQGAPKSTAGTITNGAHVLVGAPTASFRIKTEE